MKRTLKNVRQLRFGLRLQFSLVMVFSIALITIVISLIIFKKNEQSIISEITRFSGAILKGAKRHTKMYLYYDREIRNSWKSGLAAGTKYNFKQLRTKHIVEIQQYFPDIIGKEKILDIAYLINVTDIKDWKETDKNRFIYFKRKTPGILEYSKNDPVLTQLLDYYMTHTDTEIHMVFAKSMKQDSDEKIDKEFEDIVAVGLPIFSGDDTEKLYNKYNDFHKKFLSLKQGGKKDEKESIEEELAFFETEFVKRLVYNYTDFDYQIKIDSDEQIEKLYTYFWAVRYKGKLTKDQKKFLHDEFTTDIITSRKRFSYQKYRELCDTYTKKYNLYPRYPKLKNWSGFYRYLIKNKFDLGANMPIEKLALEAYRSDLNGILGLHLLSSEFFTNLEENRVEVFNIGLSLFVRFIIIALFFPTFIIRKLNLLAEGAYEIGRGNFDKRIEVGGSDEMGRLADIFNIMGKNLKRAREEMIEKSRMEDELKTAQQIQEILLPESLPEIPGLFFAAHYSSQSEAGGDYYDFLRIDDEKLGICVADVSGHGVGAGLVMTMTRTLLNSYSTDILSTKEMFSMLNEHLYNNTASNYFVSMFYGILNLKTLKMSFSSAGHHPAVVIRKRSIKELPAGGVALGAVGAEMFERFCESKNVQLEKGDYLVQYTDGVVEAMNSTEEEYGEERFFAVMLANATKGAESMKDAVIKDLKKFTGNTTQHDDITMIIVEIS